MHTSIFRASVWRWGQTLFSAAQQQNKGQRAQTVTQKLPPEYEEELLYFEGGRALGQAA